MNPEDLLIENGKKVKQAFTSFLGVQREAFVCPECGVACEQTRVYDPQRASFDGGESPAWTCGECERDFVRDVSDDTQHTMDLYGRDPPE